MSGEQAGSDGLSGLADPKFTKELREQMVKFATLQLGDPAAAEDAVQEALIGALKNAQAFRGAAALRTWVFAILKNKIADTLRQRQRLVFEGSLSAGGADAEEDEAAPSVFDARGHWQLAEKPVDWGDPEASFHQADFWRVFTACLDHLPPRQARVLMMREFIEFDAEEICRSVGITATNLHVTLHRARLRLRECLEDHWFAGEARPC
jgi:RNA polymerase sigma-70 factor (ECF subfamily)